MSSLRNYQVCYPANDVRRKYEHSKSFGLITSSSSNILWTNSHGTATGAGQAVVAANEEVICWDIKKGELLSRWRDENCKAQVTALAQSKTDNDVFAVGYEDGSIRLWDSKISTTIVNFNGHKSAITTLAFDKSGVRLASGSKDTDVIVWDLVAEVGQYKLRGHKDQVTGLRFMEPALQAEDEVTHQAMQLDGEEQGEGFLLTTGKDSLIKLWDLSSRYCVETHVAQTNGECWALGVFPGLDGCITAGNDGELKVWSIDIAGISAAARQVDAQNMHFLQERGTLFRNSKDRAIEVSFHPRRDYFAVHGVEKSVEIWRLKSDAEVKKSLARKKRRRREKLASGKKRKDTADVEMADDEEQGTKTPNQNYPIFSPSMSSSGQQARCGRWTGQRITDTSSCNCWSQRRTTSLSCTTSRRKRNRARRKTTWQTTRNPLRWTSLDTGLISAPCL